MNINDKLRFEEGNSIGLIRQRSVETNLKTVGKLTVVVTRKDGTVEPEIHGENSRVNAGAAAEYAALFSGTQPAQFTYLALTATTVTPASGDTALSGEITSNGCARAAASIAYTAPASVGGTYNATFTHTWTCSTAAQNCNSLGLFNAASAGTMFSEIAFSSQASLNPGDSLAVTYTISS